MANLPHTFAFPLESSPNSAEKGRTASPRPSKASPVPAQEAAPPQKSSAPKARKIEDIDSNHAGPRKLVRPSRPEGMLAPRSRRTHGEPQLMAHQEWSAMQSVAAEGSHAEAFYFQKQMQSQIPMVFVLDNGEKIEGCIEWYDRYAVKVRHANQRVLIYKSSIKYIYKAGDVPGGL